MQIGQFLYGMVNDSIELIQSENVDRLLSEDNLRFLYDLGNDKKYADKLTWIFESDKAISKTVLSVVYDKHGRQGILNHTIIIKFDYILSDILTYTNLMEKLDKYFITKIEGEIQKPLPPIEISDGE